MSPPERIAAAIAAGTVSVREGEQLLGFLALAPSLPWSSYSRATWYRRQYRLRVLGVDVDQLGRAT